LRSPQNTHVTRVERAIDQSYAATCAPIGHLKWVREEGARLVVGSGRMAGVLIATTIDGP
jgi:hypothetical protein